ncbi:MAG: transglutaminase domain-containing protein [Candidatus Nitrohelix vancouverensis]|uniref:Transglutaminase domain-containing protein n=1 Tax=Candidatus Nitrohelix vancouverensis TaxID=2705534 RepID=A0A7T0C1S2_9BACT|nr:MAG: transglutaminase domain-containing protein [Candidatus Nitrohelix vancouverensis]
MIWNRKQRVLIAGLLGCFILFLGGASAAPTADSLDDHWLGIYFQGKKVGFTHVREQKQADGASMYSKSYVRFVSEGVDQTTIFTQETRLDSKGSLAGFYLLQEIMGARQEIHAEVVNGRLEYRVQGEGFDRTKSISMEPEFFVSANYLQKIAEDGLIPGRKGTVSLFMESFQMLQTLEYEILRREDLLFDDENHKAFVVRQRMGGMESQIWITPDGKVLKETTPNQFVSVVETEEQALDMAGEPVSVSSLITLSLVKPRRPIVDPFSKFSARYEISGLRRKNLIPEDQRQTIVRQTEVEAEDFVYQLRVISESASGPRSSPGFPIEDASLQIYLEDTVKVQSRHGMIRALAKELIADEDGAWEAAQAINAWVYNNLEKTLSDSASALDALRTRKGECQSHTYLFTAIARAAGIPTRMANGLVYSEKYGGFLYHAWPEVYVGEWRALDPTMGQNRVDATHLKLSLEEGNTSFHLMEFIGKVKIEPIEK